MGAIVRGVLLSSAIATEILLFLPTHTAYAHIQEGNVRRQAEPHDTSHYNIAAITE